MNIVILCVISLFATAAVWLYLSNRTQPAVKEETAEEAVPTVVQIPGQEAPALIQEELSAESVTEAEKETPVKEKKPLFRKPTGKQLVFYILMALTLCGLSVALTLIYPSNTLTANSKLLILVALLFAAAYVDAKERIIPNWVVLAGLVLRVVFWCIELFTVTDQFWSIMKNDLLACLLVVAFFVVGVLLVKGGIGMGDIKLMLVMCLFQGFYGVVSSLFCSLFVAFFYAIGVLIMKKKTRKDSVAFAPAILLGTILSVFITGM